MTFSPKFPSFRARIVGFAIFAAIFGSIVLLSGRDPCGHGRDVVVVAAILAVAAAVPEYPAKKVQPEKYPLTGSKP